MLPILALLVLSLSGAPTAAQGTSSVCKDGTKSAAVGRGACSGHGGVDAKATEAAAKMAKATVSCTDGTSSAGGRGACSGHGGIAKAKATAMSKAPTTMAKPTMSMAKPAVTKADTAMKKPMTMTSKAVSKPAAKPKP